MPEESGSEDGLEHYILFLSNVLIAWQCKNETLKCVFTYIIIVGKLMLAAYKTLSCIVLEMYSAKSYKCREVMQYYGYVEGEHILHNTLVCCTAIAFIKPEMSRCDDWHSKMSI